MSTLKISLECFFLCNAIGYSNKEGTLITDYNSTISENALHISSPSLISSQTLATIFRKIVIWIVLTFFAAQSKPFSNIVPLISSAADTRYVTDGLLISTPYCTAAIFLPPGIPSRQDIIDDTLFHVLTSVDCFYEMFSVHVLTGALLLLPYRGKMRLSIVFWHWIYCSTYLCSPGRSYSMQFQT